MVLKKLELDVEVYYASEIDEEAINVSKMNHGDEITYLGDVELFSEKQVTVFTIFQKRITICHFYYIFEKTVSNIIYNYSNRLFDRNKHTSEHLKIFIWG